MTVLLRPYRHRFVGVSSCEPRQFLVRDTVSHKSVFKNLVDDLGINEKDANDETNSKTKLRAEYIGDKKGTMGRFFLW